MLSLSFSLSLKGIGRAPHGKPCKGIDIGTGASCIYPLLGVSVMGNWSFIATDTDAVSAEWAKRNVRSNGLQVPAAVMRRVLHYFVVW